MHPTAAELSHALTVAVDDLDITEEREDLLERVRKAARSIIRDRASLYADIGDSQLADILKVTMPLPIIRGDLGERRRIVGFLVGEMYVGVDRNLYTPYGSMINLRRIEIPRLRWIAEAMEASLEDPN